jgi:negative regulator of sigma E activity
MCVGVPDDFETEMSSVLRAEPLRTSAVHDAAILARARELCAPVRSRRPRYVVPFAVAASLALVTGVYVKYGTPMTDNGLVRGGQAVDLAALVPANGATLEAPPNEFQWPEQAGAESYRVVLRNAAGTPIWRSEPVELNHASIDAALHDETARTYYWTVEVEGAGAARELGPFWFQLQ